MRQAIQRISRLMKVPLLISATCHPVLLIQTVIDTTDMVASADSEVTAPQ